MLTSTEYGKLGNFKRYQTSIEQIMSDHSSTEETANRISSGNVEREVSEIQTLTQEDVNELIKGFIGPLTRQLEELTRLVQGMTAWRHPNFYPRTEFGNTSGTAIPQSDKFYLVAWNLCAEVNRTNSENWKFLNVNLNEQYIATTFLHQLSAITRMKTLTIFRYQVNKFFSETAIGIEKISSNPNVVFATSTLELL